MTSASQRAAEGAVTSALAWARRLDWRARRGGQAGVVAILSCTLWLNWGSTYYLLTVLAQPMTADTGWSLTSLTAGLSLGLVIAGLASPAMGRVIERHGGRPVLTFGSAALAIGLTGLGFAQAPLSYFSAWTVLGIGMAASLYDAAFAGLGRHYGLQARGMISGLMLINNFIMTAWWPLSAVLVAMVGWRGACFCYAGMHLALGLPLHFFLFPAEKVRPAAARSAAPPGSAAGAGHGEARSRRSLLVWLLGANLTLQVAIGSVVAVHVLTLLQGLGVAFASAVALGSVIWLAQGGGRLLEALVGRHFHPVWEGVAASACVLLGLALLLAAQPPAIAVGLVVFGLGNGVRGIVKGTLPLVLFGAEGYATLVGRLGLPTLIAQAAGPAFGAVALTRWGVAPTLLAVTALAFLNLLLAYALRLALPREDTGPAKP